jgi:hypothetical protein
LPENDDGANLFTCLGAYCYFFILDDSVLLGAMPLIKEPDPSALMAAAAALVAAGLPVTSDDFSAALFASLESSACYFATVQVLVVVTCHVSS